MFYDRQSKEDTPYFDPLFLYWYLPLPGYECNGCHLATFADSGAFSLVEKFPQKKYMRKTLFGVDANVRSFCDIFGDKIWVMDGMCMAYCPGGQDEPHAQQYYYRTEPRLVQLGIQNPPEYQPHHFLYSSAVRGARNFLGRKWAIQKRVSESTQIFFFFHMLSVGTRTCDVVVGHGTIVPVGGFIHQIGVEWGRSESLGRRQHVYGQT